MGALACTALVAGVGAVFASFTATTTNPGNSIETGTVAISDNDSVGVPLFSTAEYDRGLGPYYNDDHEDRCIVVTYTGTLPAEVKLYVESGVTGPGAAVVNMSVDVDTTAPHSTPRECDGDVLRDDDSDYIPNTTPLADLPTTFDEGYDPYPGQPMVNGESRIYIFHTFVPDDPTPNARSEELATDPFTFVWEARNV